MSINSYLNNSFTIDSVSGISIDTDTFLNIIKRREGIRYRTVLPIHSSNIAYVESAELNALTNVSIADRSTSLQANRILENEAIDFTGKTFKIDTDSFVVTDVYTTEERTITPLPLFYKHSLTNISRDENGNIVSGTTLISAQLLDSFLTPISITEYYLDNSKGIVYTNLLTEYIGSIDYTLYYVKYTINNGSTIQTYVDLLDNQPVYILATFDDLDSSLQIIADGRKVYLLEEEPTGGYTVTLPIGNNYSYKITLLSRIQILPPSTTEATDSWYVRISNGNFNSVVNGSTYKYYIAEFSSQSFDPEYPIKLIEEETSAILSSSIIKTDQENIYEDDNLSLYVDVQISDKNDIALAAFTTDPSKTGTYADNGKVFETWNFTDKVGIRSIDHRTGYIDIDGFSLKSTYQVTTTYYFQEINYEFTLIDFNPISNPDILKNRIALFINPDPAGSVSTQTLHYLTIDETGKVIESNWSEFDNDTLLYTTGNHELYYESKPSWIGETVDPTFTSLSTESSGILLILGDVTVSEAQSVSELGKYDSRRRGGGIVDIYRETVESLEPESEWYWDHGCWDGIPYPGNASYLIEVPISILEDAGGVMKMDEVRSVIDRHTAAGVYPVAKGYGVEISVSGVSPTVSGVILQWTSHGY